MTRTRRLAAALAVAVIGGFGAALGTMSAASAHECWNKDEAPPEAYQQQEPAKNKGQEKKEGPSEPTPAPGYWEDGDKICRETTVQPNWRDGYVPLFEIEDREDEAQRYDAQRWRDECNASQNESHQMCQWSYGGFSAFENRGDTNRAPNEWHAGFAATHCFLAEAAHQCEDHEASRGEGVHDAHGGAIYADVCLTPNPESKYCDEGPKDTQVGVTVMDHNPCGTIVPIVACTDEYHVVRPLDQEYTAAQMENTQTATKAIVADPARYLCGTHTSGAACRGRLQPLSEATPNP